MMVLPLLPFDADVECYILFLKDNLFSCEALTVVVHVNQRHRTGASMGADETELALKKCPNKLNTIFMCQ